MDNFVNARIEDENNNFLGVCGVSVRMAELQDILGKYEEKYNIIFGDIGKFYPSDDTFSGIGFRRYFSESFNDCNSLLRLYVR